MDEILRNLRVLGRAEAVVAEIRLREAAGRAALVGLAALAVLFAAGMANLAALIALAAVWGWAAAAAAVAGANLAAAVALLTASRRQRTPRDLELALAIRGQAVEALEAQARLAQGEVAGTVDEIRKVGRTVSALARHPLDAALPTLVIPLAGALLKALRKSRPEGE